MLLENKGIILSNNKAIHPSIAHCLNVASCTKDKGKKPEEPEKPKPDQYSVSWFNSPVDLYMNRIDAGSSIMKHAY